MKLAKQYTFFLTHNSITRQVYPENTELIFQYQKSDAGRFYVRNLETELVLTGADYDWLYAIETGANRCLDIDLEIKQLCGGSDTTYFEGLVRVVECTFNVVDCTIRLSTVESEGFECFEELMTEEKNALSAVGAKSVTLFQGTLSEQTCSDTVGSPLPGYNDTCLANPSNGWTVLEHTVTFLGGSSWSRSTKWTRETITVSCSGGVPVPPAGEGWTLETDNCPTNATYYRKPPTRLVSYIGDAGGTSEEIYIVPFSGISTVDNGRTLEDVLELWLNDCSLNLVSNFFSINADATAPSNAAYTEANLKLDNVLVFQKSDIKRHDDSNNATAFNITLKDILESIPANIAWSIEGSTFRLEHISYFTQSNGLDISTKPGAIGRNNYSYIATELPLREVFKWMDDYGSQDFLGKSIYYSTCNNGENEEIKFAFCSTDVGTIEALPDNYADSGFCLVATTLDSGTYYMNLDAGILNTTQTYWNGAFAMSRLHHYYWKWDRPQASGKMNNSVQSFNSTKRTKKQEQITVKVCCTEFATFDPADLVKTEIGWGEVEQASFNAATNELTLTILH